MKRQIISEFLGLATIVLVAYAQAPASADIIRYDPALGTFPEAQGFTNDTPIAGGSHYPAPILTNGVFHQFPETDTPPYEYQFWYYTNTPTLNFATTPYALEATLRVISSNYDFDGGGGTNAPSRCGYYLFLSDAAGHAFFIGLASDRITIATTNTADPRVGGITKTNFNTTNHTYRFVVASTNGTLFIDGAFFASVPLGPSGQYDGNFVAFGDLSHVGVSETELRLLRFQSLATTLTIEPFGSSEVRLCWNSQDNFYYQIQRAPI